MCVEVHSRREVSAFVFRVFFCVAAKNNKSTLSDLRALKEATKVKISKTIEDFCSLGTFEGN